MNARYNLGFVLWLGISLALAGAFAFVLPSVDFAWAWILGGIFLADAGSYVFHYLIDHYGRPIPGGLVHEFQRHHLIPNGIAQKSVPEVLYPAVRIAVPLLLVFGLLLASGWMPAPVGLLLFVLISCWVLAQVFHRWTHMRPPALVRLAPHLPLLVSVHEHALHHRQPFDSRFAVITGWSNYVLDALQAPRLLDGLMLAMGREKRGLVHSLKEISAMEP